MEIIKKEYRLCPCCMEQHEVQTVKFKDHTIFKGVDVSFENISLYCSLADECFEEDKMISDNDVAVKDAYRKQTGLLTSSDIIALRDKYGITQSDLCLLLGWGGKTISRYEGHQVQDAAHDMVLKKLGEDPEWFIELLDKAKGQIAEDVYKKYMEAALKLFGISYKVYLRKAVLSEGISASDDGSYVIINADKYIPSASIAALR